MSSALNSKCITESIVQFAQLLWWQGTNKMRQLPLEHQGEKITAESTVPRQILTHPQDDLAAKPQDFTVSGSTYNSGNIFVLSDEIARDNDIESRLIASFWNFLASAIDLASFHDFACSLISSRDCRSSLRRFFRKISRSRSSSVKRSNRDTNSWAACRMTSDRLRNGAFASAFRRSIRFNVFSSIVIAIVFISEF